jgi:hypothetical protein
VDCLGFGRRGGEERGLDLCGGEEQIDDVSAVEKAIPGLCGGEGECDGSGTTGGRISMGSAAAMEKKLTAAIILGSGSRGGEEEDGGD